MKRGESEMTSTTKPTVAAENVAASQDHLGAAYPSKSSAGQDLQTLFSVCRREWVGYFATPLAYVFIIVFLIATGLFTFYVGTFFKVGRADLTSFFVFHPWLYLFLLPAISMRLWAEERKTGTMELLFTLPIPLWAAIVGKFLAAWLFAGVALMLTFPMWVTVNLLGDPDNGAIVTSYLGSWFMAGAYLSIGSALSAMTQNQVIAFVLSVVVCFLFMLSGLPLVLDFFQALHAPQTLVEIIASLSFLTHYDAIQKGVLDARDFVFFIAMISFWLFVNYVVLDVHKAG